MEKLLLIILSLAFPLSMQAQFKPRAAFDYFPNGYNTQLSLPVPATSGLDLWNITVPKGHFRVRTGADYSVRGVTGYFDQTVYMNEGRGGTFLPLQAVWYVGVKYTRWGLTVKAEHLCIHPIGASGMDGIKQYGGYNMVSIGYGY